MPDIPSGSDTKNEAMQALPDGLVYALGTGLGQATFGGVGHAVGGVVAGASVGGDRGQTLSTIAVAEGTRRTLLSGLAGGGGNRRVK